MVVARFAPRLGRPSKSEVGCAAAKPPDITARNRRTIARSGSMSYRMGRSSIIAASLRPSGLRSGAPVALRGYQSGYQLILSVGITALSVGMGRFELPTPCFQIVNPRARRCREPLWEWGRGAEERQVALMDGQRHGYQFGYQLASPSTGQAYGGRPKRGSASALVSGWRVRSWTGYELPASGERGVDILGEAGTRRCATSTR